MNNKVMIIFFSVVLVIYSLLGLYIYTRALQAIPQTSAVRIYFKIAFIFLFVSPVIGKVLEHIWISPVSEFFIWAGFIWIGIFIYLVLIIFFFDIIRLINYFIPFYPSFIRENYEQVKFILSIAVTSGIVLVLFSGYLNAIHPRIKNLSLDIDKKANGMTGLNIVSVGDLHLGTIVNEKSTKKLVHYINELNPDIVLITGDIVDDNIEVVKHYDLLRHFRDIKSKYGIYSINGNHEYIGRVFKDYSYYEENHIHMLKDRVVLIDHHFYLIGRDDIESNRFSDMQRKSLHELMKEVNDSLPVILLDHQPFHLDETAENNVDVQLSGHTHNGQFWPFQYITRSMFEVSWGYLKKKNTHIYVTSGYGTAGPPVRLGNRPEILNIRLSFRD